MSSFPRPDSWPSDFPAPAALAEGRVAELTALVKQLDDSPTIGELPPEMRPLRVAENQLVQVRLGIASSLFRALRWKHEPTARHCLRVTLSSSSWATRMNLSDQDRDELELAALLHDVGKIGVPDSILTKPGPLTPQEVAVMEGHWLMGREILRCTCAAPNVVAIVAAASTWYDGSRGHVDLRGQPPPLGSRMLAVVDAFDAMMTDHVYRRALSRERAFNELYRCAGTQFDPELVRLFNELHECDQLKLRESVAQRWLQALEPELVNAQWRLDDTPPTNGQLVPESLFQQKLLANMYDAVVFVDSSLRIVQWNRGAERLTGISGSSVYQRRWLPGLLEMHDEHAEPIREEDCPVAYAIRTGVQWLRRLTIRGRGGRQVAVDAHAVPVMGSDGITQGLALLLHDVSPEISLEERCENLHELATKDPLTQVANRAEFDRAHSMFVAAHLESKLPCSLIICDIDRFKLVNDTFGHQAGDEVIQSFARLLKASCRPGDLAARYGGEEFVLLCADCDNAAAVRRAEELRKSFSLVSQPALGGKPVTASFGVTEIQPGDTPETMLRRADRGLLNAKESGRNRVVQLGIGTDPAEFHRSAHPGRHRRSASRSILVRKLVSEAPLNVCIEKLRGFVADHHAEVDAADDHQLRLKFGDEGGALLRRTGDRPIRLVMDLQFEEEQRESSLNAAARPAPARTRIHVAVSPERNRDRRHTSAAERARQLLASFQAYLVAEELEGPSELGWLDRARGLFGDWFGSA